MKIIVVAGARPNFMKVAPIMLAFDKKRLTYSDLRVLLVHTGQHYDRRMSGDFFDELGIQEPDINLDVGSGTHAQQTARVMTAFEETCLTEKPDWTIVVGDINSTMACAITAKKLGIRVAHVEAGLRSRDMTMPEEINRLCTDAVCDLFLTTERSANRNLRREGVPPERIYFVGNTMIDSLLRHLEAARCKALPEGLEEGRYGVLTLHRPSNVDSPATLQLLFSALNKIAARIPIVFPAHPRTMANLKYIEMHPAIRLTEPSSYITFLGLIARAALTLTDSGGIQEETTVLGVPCLTLRNNTERPVTCEVGTNVLAGTDPERIRAAAFAILDGNSRRGQIPEKWDGRAGQRIVNAILGRQGVEKSALAKSASVS